MSALIFALGVFTAILIASESVVGNPFGYYRWQKSLNYPIADDYELSGDFRNLGYDTAEPLNLVAIDKRVPLPVIEIGNYGYGLKRDGARLPKVDLGFSRGNSGSRLASYGTAMVDSESPLGPGRKRRAV